MTSNRTVVLKSRPVGALKESDCEIVDMAMPEPGENQILVRNIYASLDPGTRNLFGEATGYIDPIPVGSPIGCLVVGEVLKTNNPAYPVGSYMVGTGALQDYSVINPPHMTWAIDPNASSSLSHHMSVLGSAGLTAYFGLLRAGKPKAGETVLVSAAAGAVGSLVAQIAKIKGCKVVGMAGGQQKADYLVNELGLDAGIDYRGKSTDELAAAIREAAPQGVDVFFDNVGGMQLDAALANINWQGRIASCGMISEYDGAKGSTMKNLFQIIAKIVTIQGFLVFTFAEEFAAATQELGAWVDSGQLKMSEHIEQGLDNAIPGFMKLFSGENTGKAMVKIADA